MTLPLFKNFPELESHLPYIQSANLPTPVHPLNHINQSNAWIKRDDLSSEEYGGNKIRKLDFILPEIIGQNKNHVITFGALGTNAGAATALMCKRNNLNCTIYLFDQPVTQIVKDNLAIMQASGAELIYKGSLLKTALAFYLSPHRLNPRAYFLFAGCSNPVSVYAYINAAFELKAQIEANECPEPSAIHIPVGSCATLAGLTLGAKLAGLNSLIKGTRVAPSHVAFIPSCTPKVISKMMDQTATELRKKIPSLASFKTPQCILLEDQYGSGYGKSTTQSKQAIALMLKNEEIPLETTYSGKCFSSFLKDVESTEKPVMFWDTFNSRPINYNLDIEKLPKQLTAALK